MEHNLKYLQLNNAHIENHNLEACYYRQLCEKCNVGILAIIVLLLNLIFFNTVKNKI
jgi:hypothetical protein